MEAKDLYEIYKKHPVVTTDSRDCPEGSIFIALKGASFDGNKFAAMALEKGCSYAVVDEKEYAVDGDSRYILVDDTLVAFKELAREHRRQFNIPVIGITGTNGKTTTKELISAVLAEKFNVMHTEGNFNNDVGVPKTLLRLRPEHEIAVVEMGASHPGDIKKLIEYVEPTCGMITNVGRAHLQGFGSFDGVKRTKGELYDFIKATGGLIFLNESNADLVEMASRREMPRIETYGRDGEGSVTGSVTKCDPFLNFTWHISSDADDAAAEPQGTELHTKLVGAYNIDNALAAITIGLHFGVTPEQCSHAIENYTPSNDRSELTVTEHNHLIVDAYNANPSSMAAALDNFRLMDVPAKMAILGDMRELGEYSDEEHQKVVDKLKEYNINNVWLVGPEFAKTRTDFRKFDTVDEVKAEISRQQPQGHYILIKGSNGIKLFELPKLL
ncbi:UDP-N-acetylmuramoyl-tripeptide--D-alanyl-D-alanine ligase [Prevotella lacticifex]|uniref:UDP-N-acetylmuramoyl-tripeptide--D-alanyl-D-alanine ligase n=1 Tax=Prevotella lacticifex TaxID=2854755 RepID=A0A9R1CBR5_9BACT|nr:UDP-N-acetylmuramoyl-tripeptide--D-alanyl-D-alanine ligase [Prevotella lacticifex]GJG36679.1 UDP-N-acetylmuramoyl-tripeptide--D-alanyl-D-alanine ligase [Prevotella lacticifex]GJG38538.1 UDP-N-acetylmuramoyl-tripeptide--D-alanyl-D-alanine ligase [Prevotella lacticifex]GJG42779.1 UDP-N-acetylmuramoyl-tripeptide--D-alanyl-D-alanine ligase [Prevotella lacticifex]GJG44895.1 UDP-N-acetylmuramoyl-tripeptide--D-alanyl-D-alanine ligase [Prevotella lacticifex]GJG49130.1 UDP-N-acetylmuramoyl-tripeptid